MNGFGGARGELEWTYAQQVFGIVKIEKVLASVEKDGLVQRAPQLFCQSAEQFAGCTVVRRHSGFDMTYISAGFSLQNEFQHRASEPASAHQWVNRDLPDKQGIGLQWRDIGRHYADSLAIALCDRAGHGEMGADKEIAVQGIVVYKGALADQVVHGDAVCCLRGADVEFAAGSFLRIQIPLKNAHNLFIGLWYFLASSFVVFT